MKYYVVTLMLKTVNEFNKEVDFSEIEVYKADRQEHNKLRRRLVFKNDKDRSDFPIIYDALEELGDGVLRTLTVSGLTEYIATSQDTPNKALAKIHGQILREYGSMHPMALVIPNMIGKLTKAFSVMTNDKDTVCMTAGMFNQGQENKVTFSSCYFRKIPTNIFERWRG